MRRIFALSIVALIVATPVVAGASNHPVVIAEGETGSLEVVGQNPLNNRGMNAALAIKGNYAYVGSRTDAKANNANGAGILVVDIKDPAAPEVVGSIGPPDAANPGETSREMRIWPEQNLLIVMTLFSNCGEIHACTPVEGEDRFDFYDISGKNAAAPKLISSYEPSNDPHEFFLWDDPKRPGRALLYISTPRGQEEIIVTDISRARKGKFEELTKMSPLYSGSFVHSLSVNNAGTRGYIAHLTGGVGVIDTSDLARDVRKPKIRLVTPPNNAPKWAGPGPHTAVKLFGSETMLITDEVYGAALRALGGHGCPWGWARFVDIEDPAKPEVISEFKLPQNDESFCTQDAARPTTSYAAHNPTLTKNLAVITWHSGGLQVVDISSPAKPVRAAEFLADPVLPVLQEDPVLSSGADKVVAWSYPIIKDGLIYYVDVRNGLYVMRYKGPFESEVSQTRFIEGNSNLGDALRFEPI